MSQESEVAVIKGREPKQMVGEAISMIGGIERIVKRSDTVLIKPNICLPLPPEKGDSTNPEIVGSLAKLARDAGASRVVVGESACWGLYP